MNPINTEELKSWIISHANFYRKTKRMCLSENGKNECNGHMRAMRALWDAIIYQKQFDFMGLFKEVQ